ncbi:alpha-isopropylmalate synthase regulatory domain-containing protein [Neisseria subflava]|uniref:alpha-isopropylmalate synthase regulatory domain-containing protein n=1 Tax=Neisseria subflava TaxID=28449 RepID=UPI0020B86CEF|nr:alpha-isopropylmalate synthase regulatory domain-containing protein [Neisseria subflava]
MESEEALNAAFARFKELADKKREIFDEDLHALVSDEMGNMNTESYKFISQKISHETGEEPRADICVQYSRRRKNTLPLAAQALLNAISKPLKAWHKVAQPCRFYSVNAVTQGTESQGETSVRLQRGDRVVNGQGADTDVLVATAKAYLSALSKLEFGQAKPKAQGRGMIYLLKRSRPSEIVVIRFRRPFLFS